MNIISNLIFHCNNCAANRAFVTVRESTAGALSSNLPNAKFTLRERPSPIIFARIVRPMNALYNFVADSFHTKKLCSRLSSRKVRFYLENGRVAFLSPLPPEHVSSLLASCSSLLYALRVLRSHSLPDPVTVRRRGSFRLLATKLLSAPLYKTWLHQQIFIHH